MTQLQKLKEYLSTRDIQKYIFYSENQESFSVADPCKLRLTFTDMLIYENPSIICLKMGGNTITLDTVKRAKYDTQITPIGTLIKVICGHGGNEREYTIIAS